MHGVQEHPAGHMTGVVHNPEGRPVKDKTVYDVENITTRHRAIVQYHLKCLSNKEIASILQVSEQTVSIALNSPIVKEHIQRIQHKADTLVVDAANDLVALVPEVIDLYRSILADMESGAEVMHKIKVGESILDRIGLPKTKREIREQTTTHLTTEDILALRGQNLIEVQPI